jgi:hypothetical protein
METSHKLKETQRVFVSYRGSRKELAVSISQAARTVGWTADTVEQYLEVPFPRDSAYEFKWLTDRISERIEPGGTFVMMASDDANESHWVLWEGLEGFLKAYRVIVCWVSGTDPLKVVFPLPRFMYRLMSCPQAFIVDARGDPQRAVAAVTRILSPSRRYRVLFRIQQVATTVVCLAMGLSPVTVLLVTSILPGSSAAAIRHALLRPWVALLSLWLSMVVIGIFYPSYGGPSRLAPDRIDRHIRLVTPGFTGWRWRKIITPVSFVLACLVDGIQLFTLKSMSVIRLGTYLKASILAVILVLLYQRVQLNMFTSHVGLIYRKLLKHYGLTDLK